MHLYAIYIYPLYPHVKSNFLSTRLSLIYISLYISHVWLVSKYAFTLWQYIYIYTLYPHFIFTFYIHTLYSSFYPLYTSYTVYTYIYHYISIKAIINRSFYIPMLYPIFCPLYIYMYLGKLIIIFH